MTDTSGLNDQGVQSTVGGTLLAPFPNWDPNSQGRRTDQGWDLQAAPNTPVLAAASGTIMWFHDPNGFGQNYPVLMLDTPFQGQIGIYYGHISPDIANGTHVTAGQQIGHTLQTPGGNAAGDPGWLEMGFWGPNGPTGNGALMKQVMSTATTDPNAATAPTPVGTGAPTDTPTPRGPVDANAVNAFIAAHPELAWVMSDPELGHLMQQAVQEGWNATKWQAALESSNWWKTHSAATRDWIELVGTDPAEAARRVQQQQHEIQASARNLGINLNDKQLASLATQMLEFGWDQTEINQHLSQLVTVGANGQPQLQLYRMQNGQEIDLVTGRRAYYGPQNQPGTPDEASAKAAWGAGNYGSWVQPDGTKVFYATNGQGPSTGGGPAPYTGSGAATLMPGGGQIGATAQQLTQMAHQYLVPVSDQTITQWATQIASGQVDQKSFESYLAEQAKSLFPGMAGAIDSGVTPYQYTDPYRQLASRVLGVNPTSLDFTQPQWMKALTQIDPKTGARTSMSLTDWMNTMMSDPTYGYQRSQNAQDRAAAFAQALGQMFGKSPSGGTGWSGVQPLRV